MMAALSVALMALWFFALLLILAWSLSQRNSLWIALPALWIGAPIACAARDISRQENIEKVRCERIGGEWVWLERKAICLKKGVHLQ